MARAKNKQAGGVDAKGHASGETWWRFFTRFLTWWQGQTWNTQFYTWRHGERVGEDEFGNVYYRSRDGALDPALGHERRWVIFKDESDASTIPPGWHGWMHHRDEHPPKREDYAPHEWELPHLPNRTGTPAAWHPPGSLDGGGQRPRFSGDYAPWQP